MDEKFQDGIDDYLLNRMSEAEKSAFLHEVEQDDEKKKQLEFTKQVRDAIRSREEKLQVLTRFQEDYDKERNVGVGCAVGAEFTESCRSDTTATPVPVRSTKKMWFWISGVAALVVIGFFAVRPMWLHESSSDYNGIPMEQMRGGDEVFTPASADSTDNDTVRMGIDKKEAPDE